MNMKVAVNSETKMTWVAPKLKKVDVEAITAANNNNAADGTFSGSTS